MNSLEGRARFTKLALPLLSKIASPILQEMMFDRLAEIVRMDREKLIHFANTETRPQRSASETNKASRPKQTKRNAQMSPMRLAIALLLQYPHLAEEVTELSGLLSLTLPGCALLCQMITIIKGQPQLTTGSLLEYWRDEAEYTQLLKLAAWELNVPVMGIAAEFQAIIKRLPYLQREQHIEELLHRAQQADLSVEEKELLQKLLADKNSISV
jgi:DNA primase